MIARAYDDYVVFRLAISNQPRMDSIIVVRDPTELKFADDYPVQPWPSRTPSAMIEPKMTVAGVQKGLVIARTPHNSSCGHLYSDVGLLISFKATSS